MGTTLLMLRAAASRRPRVDRDASAASQRPETSATTARGQGASAPRPPQKYCPHSKQSDASWPGGRAHATARRKAAIRGGSGGAGAASPAAHARHSCECFHTDASAADASGSLKTTGAGQLPRPMAGTKSHIEMPKRRQASAGSAMTGCAHKGRGPHAHGVRKRDAQAAKQRAERP